MAMMQQPGMIDPVEMMRRKRMMPPPMEQPPMPQGPPMPNPAIPPPVAQPQTRPALDAFRTHLGARPGSETDPRTRDRILGALVGAFAGAPLGMATTDRRHIRAEEDWSKKAGGLKAMADMENAEADDKLRATIASIKADQDERNLESQDRYRGGRLDNEADRNANTAAYQGGQLDLGAERNKLTGQRNQQRGRYEQGQLGLGARNAATNESRAQTSKDYLGFRKSQAATAKTGKPSSPASQDKAQNMATEDVLIENPDWAKYVDPNTGAVKPPKNGFFGGAPDEQSQIDFQAFLTARAKRAEDRLKGRRGGDIPLGYMDEDEEE